DAGNRAVRPAADALDLAVLDDMDATVGGRAGIAPGHRVVPRRAAASLQRRTVDRITGGRRDIERRAIGLGLLGRQPFVVDAVQAVGVNVPLEGLLVVD